MMNRAQAIALVNKIYEEDEYAEYNKALADGKIIEQSYQGRSSTGEFESFNGKFNCNFLYRIKPDEPTFKVGDWVTRDCIQIPFQILYTVKDEIVPSTLIGQQWKANSCKLWKPTKYEWCVFWDDGLEATYMIARYEAMLGALYVSNGNYGDETFEWANIAPLDFIQTLKNLL